MLTHPENPQPPSAAPPRDTRDHLPPAGRPATPRAGNLLDPQIENAFTYHAPKPSQPERYELLRGEAKKLAYLITATCPPSRERSLALTNLEQAVMWANSSIARNE